jgi:hypothetical protein
MKTQNNRLTKAIKAEKRKLDQRIESIGWAFFLVISGALLIAPEGLVPDGTWLLGTGLIILGSMGIRYLYRIRVDGFWTVLGILALGYGISEFFGLNLPIFPVLLVIIGVVIVYKALFGKTESHDDFWKFCWDGENDESAGRNAG